MNIGVPSLEIQPVSWNSPGNIMCAFVLQLCLSTNLILLWCCQVSRGILVKMVALAHLVSWVLLETLALLELKERTVQLASLDPPVIQVVKAFQASQVNREILDLLAKLELKENQD